MAGQVEDDRCTYKNDLYLPSLGLVFVSRFCSLHADNNPVLKEKRLYFIPIEECYIMCPTTVELLKMH